MNTQKKILIAYHANCADGIGAAHAVTSILANPSKGAIDKPKLEYLAMRYSEENYTLLLDTLASDEYTELYVVDFSLPVVVLHEVIAIQGIKPPLQSIYIMDHHATAYEMYSREYPDTKPKWEYYFHESIYNDGATRLEIILDINECGTTLVYKELGGHAWTHSYTPLLYLYIKDRDLWQKRLQGTDEIHQVLKRWVLSIPSVHIKKQLAAMDKLMLAMEKALPEVIKEGKALLTAYQELVQKYVSSYGILASKVEAPNAMNIFYAQCPPEYASDVGNILAEKQGYYSVTYSPDPGLSTPDEFKYKLSLRSVSRPDGSYVDVSILAELFGGGGHAKAAGFYASNIYQVLSALQDIDVRCHMVLEVPTNG